MSDEELHCRGSGETGLSKPLNDPSQVQLVAAKAPSLPFH